MTGDTIEIFSNTKTNQIDSLNVHDNAYIDQKDTIEGYNQVKGKFMYGLFKENNQLDEVNFIKNTETIYYWRDEKDGYLMGINKAVASQIRIEFEENDFRSIEYLNHPENITYRPKNFPENARKLRGFHWRGEERLLRKEDLFKDDPPLDLPKIKGIPLPDEESFFGKPKKKEEVINKKSRLNLEDLQKHDEDQPTHSKDENNSKKSSDID